MSDRTRLANLQIAHYLELFILAEAQIGGVEDEQRVHELFRENDCVENGFVVRARLSPSPK